MNNEELTDQMISDVFGVLTQSESDALRASLSADPSGLNEYEDNCEKAREALSALVLLVPPVTPPEQLKSRILEGVRSSSSKSQSESSPNVIPILSRNSSGRSGVVVVRRWVVGALAIAASIVIVVLAVQLYSYHNREQKMLAQLEQNRIIIEEEQIYLQSVNEMMEMMEIMNSSSARLSALNGTKAAPGAIATLVYDHKSGRGVLVGRNLPPLPSGHAYELWYISDPKNPTPGVVFKVDSNGDTRTRAEIPIEGRKASLFAVTLEREEGSAKPTSELFLVSSSE
ncbi:MAG: anti-sigma factor domain-containing protein [Pyrinomonadaceae bacterium]